MTVNSLFQVSRTKGFWNSLPEEMCLTETSSTCWDGKKSARAEVRTEKPAILADDLSTQIRENREVEVVLEEGHPNPLAEYSLNLQKITAQLRNAQRGQTVEWWTRSSGGSHHNNNNNSNNSNNSQQHRFRHKSSNYHFDDDESGSGDSDDEDYSNYDGSGDGFYDDEDGSGNGSGDDYEDCDDEDVDCGSNVDWKPWENNDQTSSTTTTQQTPEGKQEDFEIQEEEEEEQSRADDDDDDDNGVLDSGAASSFQVAKAIFIFLLPQFVSLLPNMFL